MLLVLLEKTLLQFWGETFLMFWGIFSEVLAKTFLEFWGRHLRNTARIFAAVLWKMSMKFWVKFLKVLGKTFLLSWKYVPSLFGTWGKLPRSSGGNFLKVIGESFLMITPGKISPQSQESFPENSGEYFSRVSGKILPEVLPSFCSFSPDFNDLCSRTPRKFAPQKRRYYSADLQSEFPHAVMLLCSAPSIKNFRGTTFETRHKVSPRIPEKIPSELQDCFPEFQSSFLKSFNEVLPSNSGEIFPGFLCSRTSWKILPLLPPDIQKDFAENFPEAQEDASLKS